MSSMLIQHQEIPFPSAADSSKALPFLSTDCSSKLAAAGAVFSGTQFKFIMLIKHLKHLVCPEDHSDLELVPGAVEVGGKVQTGILRSANGSEYQIVDFIPRFVPEDNYCENFGFQWKKHAKTQLDRFSDTNVSEERFFNESKWDRDLSGQTMVEVGSGAGRFTPHAASTGATVVSLDFSQAVEANYEHNGHLENLLIIQADLYNLPLRQGYFDKLICFGVLQHTPDVKKSFDALPKLIRNGGQMAIDCYVRNEGFVGTIKQALKTKYWARCITRHMPAERLYGMCRVYVSTLWPVVCLVSKIPKIGPKLVRFMVIADNGRGMGLDDKQRREWAVLDTFDWLSPAYDSPQKRSTIQYWMESAGLENIDVHYGYNGVEARGQNPAS